MAVRTWTPPESEVHEAAKQVAAEAALALTTYEADSTLEDVVGPVATTLSARRDLARAAASLHRPGRWSRGIIVYPQMGGLADRRASVMVVVEQTVGRPGEAASAVTRTLDIRLVRDGGSWRFERLASDGGDPVPRPDDLDPVAEAVLDDSRIELPSSARWDIHRGAVSKTLLEVMAALADRTPYGVVVLSSGHPVHVFDTERQSSHAVGHAVDIHRFGDERVVDGRSANDTRTRRTVEWLYEDERVTNLGSPWALDGYGGRSFTDAVHHDHVHVSAYAGQAISLE